jgi:hypothetical protein
MKGNVACMCDYRRGSDWWLDLLTTYARTLTTRDFTLHITDTRRD